MERALSFPRKPQLYDEVTVQVVRECAAKCTRPQHDGVAMLETGSSPSTRRPSCTRRPVCSLAQPTGSKGESSGSRVSRVYNKSRGGLVQFAAGEARLWSENDQLTCEAFGD
jgi:hypothetical protein